MRRMNGGGIRPLVTVAAATAALLLPLSACGGDEQDTNSSSENAPKPDDNAESSPSPTSTKTPPPPSMPELPAAAEQETRDGAEAFGEYYIKLWHWSEQNDHFDKVESFIASNCDVSCKPMRGPAAGRYTKGGEMVVLDSRAGKRVEKHHWNVSVTFSIKAGTWVANTPDATPEEKKIQDATAQIRLEYEGGAWHVYKIQFEI